MTGVTWQDLAGVIVFLITVAGTGWAIWWRIESRVGTAQGKAEDAHKDLHSYKLHVAEHYATKAGTTEQINALSVTVKDVGERMDKRLDGITERLDRVIEANHTPRRRQP